MHRTRRLLVAGLTMFGAGSVVTAWTGAFVGSAIGFALAGLAKPMISHWHWAWGWAVPALFALALWSETVDPALTALALAPSPSSSATSR
ncbi:MAG TPA: hypothetical protein VK990_01945 [Acidimicrobiia bacterium]|nr:hypothetical protein [Acidimicrobiia bacterium]